MKISAIKLPAKENLNQTVSIALIKWTSPVKEKTKKSSKQAIFV
jgi:hypothetical protein